MWFANIIEMKNNNKNILIGVVVLSIATVAVLWVKNRNSNLLLNESDINFDNNQGSDPVYSPTPTKPTTKPKKPTTGTTTTVEFKKGQKVYAKQDAVYLAPVKKKDNFWWVISQDNIIKRFNRGEYMGKVLGVQGNYPNQIVMVDYSSWYLPEKLALTHALFIK